MRANWSATTPKPLDVSRTIYLADSTVFVLRRKHPGVAERFERLLIEGRLAVCQMSGLEHLTNAPDPASYEVLWSALHEHRWLDVTAAAMDRAMEVHRAMGARSQHRNLRLPDLIIAATAEVHGATVLHYDQDFDRIAAVTEQPTEWVVPRGSL
jgi:predicted nucleic acid-binding protein